MSSAGISRDQLRSIVERIERLEEEKAATASDIKEVYAEAKGNGFNTATIRQVIKLRKLDTAERQEQEALLDVYLAALGMTPIERAIADKDGDGGSLTPEQRAERARRRTSEAMDDAKDLSARMLADGLISEEAHAEQVRTADAVAAKFGTGEADSTPSGIPREGRGTLKRRVGKSIKAAVAALGTPAELTDEERAQGMTAAFIGKDGTRLSIGTNVRA